jgi:hypothetical protein
MLYHMHEMQRAVMEPWRFPMRPSQKMSQLVLT